MKRRTVLLGVGTFAAGTMLFGGGGAFTNLNADRGVNVSATSDPDALLGLVDNSSGSEIKGPSDTALLYEITDNAGVFSAGDIEVTVSKLVDQSGTEITDPPVQAAVSGSGTQFTVDISCSGDDSSLGDAYEIEVEFDAVSDSLSINATRTTDSFVDITCGFDYGDESNYRDQSSGDAVQPTDPSGTIENPSAVNQEDGNVSTAISSGSEADLRVGFALPPTDESASTYEMRFVVNRMQIGQGTFGFSLLNSSGQELTSRQVLSVGDNTYSFTAAEQQNISTNSDDLYLIIDSNTPGSGNREIDIDYFELLAT